MIDANTNRFNLNQGYGYDKNGNLINDAEGRGFTFNGENKQTVVMQGTTKVGEYFFDGEGKRVKKKVYDATGTLKEETVFVYSAGKLIAEYSTEIPQNPTINYTATDQLGSPRVITDGFGQVKSRRDFQPFGEEVINNIGERPTNLKYGTADDIRQKFTGYQKDEETKLDFAEARMYENRHARFTAVDPLLASGKSANPQTFNRFVYVMNNPVFLSDPTGKCPVGQCPENYPGPVYTDGNGTFDNVQHKGYSIFTGDIVVEDQKGGTGTYRIFNFGEGSNGGSGWYRIEPERLNPSSLSLITGPGIGERQFYQNPITPALWSPSFSAGAEENSSAPRLAFEFFTGFGPQERQFGPNSDMTRSIRNSPMLEIHKQRFIEGGGASYDSEIYNQVNNDYPPRYGMPNAPDGPLTTGLDSPRQFVGSFNVNITELRNNNGNFNGNALFQVRNPTHFNSLAYGSVFDKIGVSVPTWRRSGNFSGRVMGRTDQTFWWVEKDVIKR
jgi:RHS repeat-associated protein